MVWLGLISKDFYAKQLSSFMSDDIKWLPAIVFYLLFVFGLVFFAIKPAIEEKSLKKAIMYGGLLGLLSYATYDLTNLATLKDWPLIITIVDIIWGTLLGASISAISYYISMRILKAK